MTLILCILSWTEWNLSQIFSLIFSVVLVMCWLRMTDWGVRFNEAEELAIPHGHFTNYTVRWVCNSLPFQLLLFRTITTGVLCGEGEGEFLSNEIFVFIIKCIYLFKYPSSKRSYVHFIENCLLLCCEWEWGSADIWLVLDRRELRILFNSKVRDKELYKAYNK